MHVLHDGLDAVLLALQQRLSQSPLQRRQVLQPQARPAASHVAASGLRWCAHTIPYVMRICVGISFNLHVLDTEIKASYTNGKIEAGWQTYITQCVRTARGQPQGCRAMVSCCPVLLTRIPSYQSTFAMELIQQWNRDSIGTATMAPSSTQQT